MFSFTDLIFLVVVIVIVVAVVLIVINRFFPVNIQVTKTPESVLKGVDQETLWKALNIQIVKLHDTGQYDAAIEVAEEALKAATEIYGPNNSQTAISMNNLAAIYQGQGRLPEAEELYKKAMVIWEKSAGKNSYEVASCLNNLADVYLSQQKYKDSETFYKLAFTILENLYGKEHPNLITVMENMVELYKKTASTGKATILEEKIRLIKAKAGKK
jgi:tetratricopeptide (TPR) repeat protein